MNVLILCKRYYTNKDLIRDRFGRLYHLPVALAKRGVSVSVLAIDYRNSEPESVNMDGVYFKTIPVSISRLPSIWFDVRWQIKSIKPDVIIASGDSHIGYFGRRLSRDLNCHFVFDVYDYYPAFPGNRVPGMKWMFNKALLSADAVLSASKYLADEIRCVNENTIVIANGVDTTLFRPQSDARIRDRLNISRETAVIGYFGSIVPSRGPILIDACRRLIDENFDLCLLMAGSADGVDLEESWIKYLGPKEQSAIPQLIAACDVVAIPYAKDTFNERCGACKIAEYLACAKPIVATTVADHCQYFQSAPGSLCEPNAQSMAVAIRQQLDVRQIADLPDQLKWTSIGQTLYKTLTKVCSD